MDNKPTAPSLLEILNNADARNVAEKNPTVSNEHIVLRIITSSMTNEMKYRVRTEIALGRLKASYCRAMGLEVEALCFVFDGQRIADQDTPNSLGMINGDVIEIYEPRIGGGV